MYSEPSRSGNATATRLILMLVSTLGSGCAGSGSNPELQRSDSEAFLSKYSCPEKQKPTCIRKMGTVERCFCTDNDDFREAWEDQLKRR